MGTACKHQGSKLKLELRAEDQRRKLPSGYSEFGVIDGCVDIDLFEIPNNEGRRLRPSYPEGHHQAADTPVVLEVNDIG